MSNAANGVMGRRQGGPRCPDNEINTLHHMPDGDISHTVYFALVVGAIERFSFYAVAIPLRTFFFSSYKPTEKVYKYILIRDAQIHENTAAVSGEFG